MGLPLSWVKGPAVHRRVKLEPLSAGCATAVPTGWTAARALVAKPTSARARLGLSEWGNGDAPLVPTWQGGLAKASRCRASRWRPEGAGRPPGASNGLWWA